MTKTCPRCHKTRSLESFMKGERQMLSCEVCREYARANNHKQRRAKPDRVRSDNLWAMYKISMLEYEERRFAQDFRCAICGTHESDIKVASTGRPRLDGTPNAEPFKLVVDHCHSSKNVRGLLCAGCNAGLGSFRDSPDLLLAAARYLTEREPPDQI
jgi:hypothetical protein